MYTVFKKVLGELDSLSSTGTKFLVEPQVLGSIQNNNSDSTFVVNSEHFDIELTVILHYDNDIDENERFICFAGKSYSELTDPVNFKLGYVFDGWYSNSQYTGDKITSSTLADGNITDLYAKWVAVDFTGCTTFEAVSDSTNTTLSIASINKKTTSNLFVIDWGDGELSIYKENVSAPISHIYSTPGTHTVRVTDDITAIHICNGNTTSNIFSRYTQVSTTIGNISAFNSYEFFHCIKITSLSFLSLFPRLTALPTYCFAYCNSLASLSGIPSGITTFSNYCFEYCSALTSLSGIPSGVTSFGPYCFYYCTGLTSLSGIPSTLTSIGQYCFGYCSKITNLSAVRSNITLGTYCFTYCTGLTNISTLPARTTLPQGCFNRCSNLTSVTLGSTYTSLGTYCFYYCSKITTADISSSQIKSIPAYCFGYCTTLKTVKLPETFTGTIGANAFSYDYALTDINIPDGTTAFDSYAFRYCYTLPMIEIPASVASLAESCFAGDRALKTITCHRMTAPSTSTTTFGNSTASGANQYTGYTTRASGTNTLTINPGATGYDTGVWLSPLCNSSYCGFHLEYIGGGEILEDGEYEYLESTGTQYIDTNYIPNNSSGIRAEYECLKSPSDNVDEVVFGCRSIADGRWFINPGLSTINWSWNTWGSCESKEKNKLYVHESNYLNCREIIINDTTYKTNLETLANITHKAYIFAGNSIGTTGYYFTGRIYNLKISEGTSVVHDFVPYVKDGVPCMYDKVSETYFYNQGTGNFKVGAKVVDKNAQRYEQDGLICHWNAIESAGPGLHSTANEIVDLISGSKTTLTTGFELKDKYIQMSESSSGLELQKTADLSNLTAMTFDFVIKDETMDAFPDGNVNRVLIEGNIGNSRVFKYFGIQNHLKRNWASTYYYYALVNAADINGTSSYTGALFDDEQSAVPRSHLTFGTTVVNGNTITIYKNGIYLQTITCSHSSTKSDIQKIALGRINNSTVNGRAKIYDLKIYNRSLTYDEILSNYNIANEVYGLPVVTKSFQFDGTVDCVLKADNYTTFIDPRNTSFSIWFKNGTTPNKGEFFKYSTLALGLGNSSSMDNVGQYLWILYEAVAWNKSWNWTSIDQNWHHICITISASSVPIVYLDGSQIMQGTGYTFNQTAFAYTIGAAGLNSNTRAFTGNLTRFCVFNKVLTPTEVSDDFMRYCNPPDQSIVKTYIPMNVVNNLVKDYVGTYNMTIYGTATQSNSIPKNRPF